MVAKTILILHLEINLGGIVGTCHGCKEIENCSNDGEIAGRVVGGICGFYHYNLIDNSNLDIVKKCYNSGNIKTIDGIVTSSHAGGGIIGKLMDNVNIRIENCYNRGNIISDHTTKEGDVGGIIGFCQYQNQKGELNIINSYNVGIMNLANTNFKGGIIGLSSNENSSTIKYENNYWLSGCGASYGIGYPTNNTGAMPKNSTEIKNLSNLLGNEYTNDIKIEEGKWKYNEGYPILKWQLK